MKFFLTPLAPPSGPLHSKKFQKMLILAFEANSALSRENETKIMKITHSATADLHLIAFFCFYSWPHKWTKNSRNNSPPEKSWKSSHRPGNGNVWIMLLGLFRDSSRYTLRKFTIDFISNNDRNYTVG